MDDLDLDIENYNLDDILNLFSLTKNFSKEDLKQSYRVVLKTHPDKSGLDMEYFIFFSKAFKIVKQLYEIKHRMNTEQCVERKDYSPMLRENYNRLEGQDQQEEEQVQQFLSKFENVTDFNKWFNDKFEKHHVKEEEHGYGDWLKSDEGIVETAKISQSQLGSEMEKHKQRIQGIIPYQGIQETFSSSSIVSGDGFSDLKQAYEESVIPVTQQDYNKMKKFNSVNEYTNFRDNEHKNVKPMSQQNASNYFKKKNRDLEDQCVAMTFENIKHSEKQKEQNNLFWSDLKRLT